MRIQHMVLGRPIVNRRNKRMKGVLSTGVSWLRIRLAIAVAAVLVVSSGLCRELQAQSDCDPAIQSCPDENKDCGKTTVISETCEYAYETIGSPDDEPMHDGIIWQQKADCVSGGSWQARDNSEKVGSCDVYTFHPSWSQGTPSSCVCR